jgi:DNA repair photolyase
MEMGKEFKSFYKTVGGNEGGKCHYPTRLDTYGCGCSHDCQYCVSPDTMVLMYDGTQKRIADISVGDEVYGVEKDGTYYKFVKSIVLNKWTVRKKAYKVTLSNGTKLVCSGDHKWLTNRGWKYTSGSMTGEDRRPYLTLNDYMYSIPDTHPIGTIHGLPVLDDICLKDPTDNQDLRVVSVEEYSNDMELIDITTSTENFIADGVVSHNCYAKSLLDFRKLWNPADPAVADIEKIRRKIAKLPQDTPAIRLGGMTDCFQPAEAVHGVTYETIQALNERRIPYLIVTKSAMVAEDRYMDILDRDLAHIQITVTTTDDARSVTYEKASVPSARIAAIEKLQAAGFDVTLRLSPYIPEFVDIEVLNAVKCDKILVEFLRVNSWIEKWFDIDYSGYTIKQGGYRHLPLEKKKEYLSKITGFSQVTVCEDEDEAYAYWKEHFNPNPDDCCNLRRG